jgi:hypothetical protein
MARRSLLKTIVLAASLALMGIFAASSSAAPAGHVFSAIDSAASIPNYGTAATRNGFVVLQAWETAKMHELKKANPNIKVLEYKNLGFAAQGTGPEGISASGVNYSEAKSSWFLKNTAGKSFTAEPYPWLWAMDVGSREYQEKWAANVIAEMTAQGWDGVMLDDANATMKYQYNPSSIAKYPNDAAYAGAMESALAYIGPKIQAAGKLAIPNFATWVEYPQTYDSWLQYVSGGLDEMFVKWGRGNGEGYREAGQWQTQIEEARYANQHGKIFLAYTQGATGETQAQRYGYASLLMGSESASLSSYSFTPNYSTEQWLPEYEYEIGNATGLASSDSTGVWRRAFTNGLVLVNPTNASKTVSFGGTYSGSGLENATGATMPAHSALVLTGNASAPVVTPPVTSTPPKKTTETPKVSPIGVTVTVGQNEVGLTWTPGTAAATTYEVIRNETPTAKTKTRHVREGNVKAGKKYRYRIVGRNKKGKVVAQSRLFKVKASKQHRKLKIQPSAA